MTSATSMFGNMPGANKFMDRLFRKADGVVWDLMTGRVGIKTTDGIATLEGEGKDAQINVNLLDQFGMEIPAFAQSTPIDAVKAGDIIFFGASDKPGWVLEKLEPASVGKAPRFVLMKVDGQQTTWTAPKVSMLGMESGVMVLRSLLSMLPGGNAGLTGLQGALMPMLMMSQMGGGDVNLESMMPMLLMGQMNATPVTAADGTAVAAPNPMAQMMPMMMMMGMMNKDKGNKGPFNRN